MSHPRRWRGVAAARVAPLVASPTPAEAARLLIGADAERSDLGVKRAIAALVPHAHTDYSGECAAAALAQLQDGFTEARIVSISHRPAKEEPGVLRASAARAQSEHGVGIPLALLRAKAELSQTRLGRRAVEAYLVRGSAPDDELRALGEELAMWQRQSPRVRVVVFSADLTHASGAGVASSPRARAEIRRRIVATESEFRDALSEAGGSGAGGVDRITRAARRLQRNTDTTGVDGSVLVVLGHFVVAAGGLRAREWCYTDSVSRGTRLRLVETATPPPDDPKRRGEKDEKLVSYLSAAFSPPPERERAEPSPEDDRALLRLARASAERAIIASSATGGRDLAPTVLPSFWKGKRRGAFTGARGPDGAIRGSKGSFERRGTSTAEHVRDAAATLHHDAASRWGAPMTSEEVAEPGFRFNVTLLERRPAWRVVPADLAPELGLRPDQRWGFYLLPFDSRNDASGRGAATYLPDVWAENADRWPTIAELLDSLADKAADPDRKGKPWRRGGSRLALYRGRKLEEK